MTKQLTIHNAQIATATVEVKTLTISGKQVTLAVFRQLQEKQLVTTDGVFAGLPWGRVNYHPDKIQETAWDRKPVGCESTGMHLHVVWQDGGELRRALVRKPEFGRFWSDETDAFVQASCCANDHARPSWATGGSEAYFTFDGMPCQAEAPGCRPPHASKRECGEPDAPALQAAIAAERERRGRHRYRWAELSDLPQLFIAV